MNDYILNDSKGHLKNLLAVTYLFEYEGETLAFFSVSNDKISAQETGSANFKQIFQGKMPESKRYRSFPAVKIGRLAVNKKYHYLKFGSQMLDYIKGLFISNNKTGCQYITVDAYKQSLQFYEKNGFQYFTENDRNKDTRQMYFSLLNLV